MNSRALNANLVAFLEHVVESEMDHTLHEINNLQIIYSMATAPGGGAGIKRVASAIICAFMKTLYTTGGGDFQKKKYVDMVF
jgi:hypothetical protein